MSNEKNFITRLDEARRTISPYNLGDDGEVSRLLSELTLHFSAPNPVEIDQIKPAGETGAEEFLQSYLDKPDAVVASRTSTILAMRDYATLRAQEAVRDFAKMMEESYAPLLMYTKNPVQHERVYTMSLADSFINKHLKG